MTDPLTGAVQRLFGLPYLFPYQRLVVANLVEAAEAAGIPILWPAEKSGGVPPGEDSLLRGETAEAEPGPETESDRSGLGRQLVILPTGAGKSLCFQLPAMLMKGPTLVIYPILSLMADQERRLRERGFSPVLLRGGQSSEEREAVWTCIKSGRSKFIIANPEVLLSPRVQEKLPGLGIVHTVIDEAHCVSEWGETFRPAYLEIAKILEKVRSPLVTAFTATASAPVLEKIERYIFGTASDDGSAASGDGISDNAAGRGCYRIIGNPDRPNIEYRAQGCILRDLAVRDLLVANERPAIVFCSSRPGTEKLARYLRNRLAEQNIPWAGKIRFYHAGLSREEKKDLEEWYLPSDGVLVSTCAFGLGVDKADIRTVIHRDCPPSVEAYLQESGRAGRDGKQSRAVLLWGPGDETRLGRIRSPEERGRIQQLFDYAREGTRCRREALLALLNYEGSGPPAKPGKYCCDVCSGESSPLVREERSLRDFFRRNRRCYTLEEAAAVLSAAETVRWSEDEAKEAVRWLLQKKALKELEGPFWKHKITQARQITGDYR
ncbi:MAG: DEAD/DEAH box helicase [Treponema sp.]|nr:DEAD/DEAH box helicase [Treponema sp.]